ncbi:unnamed protein product, partial [Urochloa humidicola]
IRIWLFALEVEKHKETNISILKASEVRTDHSLRYWSHRGASCQVPVLAVVAAAASVA